MRVRIDKQKYMDGSVTRFLKVKIGELGFTTSAPFVCANDLTLVVMLDDHPRPSRSFKIPLFPYSWYVWWLGSRNRPWTDDDYRNSWLPYTWYPHWRSARWWWERTSENGWVRIHEFYLRTMTRIEPMLPMWVARVWERIHIRRDVHKMFVDMEIDGTSRELRARALNNARGRYIAVCCQIERYRLRNGMRPLGLSPYEVSREFQQAFLVWESAANEGLVLGAGRR